MLKVALSVLIATSLPIVLPPHGALQSQQQFKSREEFFNAHKDAITEKWGLQPLDPSQKFDRMVLEEMKALDKVAGFKTIVTKGEGDQIASQPNVGIIISPSQLDFISRRSGVREFQQILRFLLAHEKAHQMQYIDYSANSVHLGEKQLRRVYECQADILAGKYLIESLGEPKREHQATIEDALQVSFDLGVEAFSDSSTYPSHDGRRIAVRLGMSSGLITLLSRRLPDPPAVEIINSLAGKINFRAGESVMSWSLRLAKKITHYKLDLWADLKLEDEDLEWDHRADHSVVRFNLRYKNTGEKRIRVDMEVQCVSVLRSDPDNTKHWLKWGAQNFIFTIASGDSHLVRGFVPCYPASGLMHVLIFPPKDTALLSAQ